MHIWSWIVSSLQLIIFDDVVFVGASDDESIDLARPQPQTLVSAPAQPQEDRKPAAKEGRNHLKVAARGGFGSIRFDSAR